MNKTIEEKIIYLFDEKLNKTQIANQLGISTLTVNSVLRKFSKTNGKRNQEIIKKALEAHQKGLSQIDSAKYAGTYQSNISRIWYEHNLKSHNRFEHIEISDYEERKKFLIQNGIDYTIIQDFWEKQLGRKYLPSIGMAKESIDFFKELNSDIPEIFHRSPNLLSLNKEENLYSKLDFLIENPYSSRKRLAKKTKVFQNSIEKMQRYNFEFSLVIGKENAQKMFAACPDLYGYEITTLFSKIINYDEKNIQWQRNYNLLEKDSNEVLKTKTLLDNLSLDLSGENFILLLLNSDLILERIIINNDYQINWKKKPKVLLLSSSKNSHKNNVKNNCQGTLERRINIIENAFNSYLPQKFDYRENPALLILPDKELNKKITNFQKKYPNPNFNFSKLY